MSDNQATSIGPADQKASLKKRSKRSLSIPALTTAVPALVGARASRHSIDSMAGQSEEERLADGRLLVLKVIGKINLRIERREYDDLTGIINQIPGDVLFLILNKLNIERLYQDIPSSLCVISAVFSKLQTDSKERFPKTILRSEDVVHHLVRYFSELLKYNDYTFASAHSRDCIRNILSICLKNKKDLNEIFSQRIEQFSKALEGFSQHTLVEIVSRSAAKYCMKLHEALKIEMERATAHYKMALQKFTDVLQNVPHQNIDVTPGTTTGTSGTNMDDELEEKTAEHMRLLTQKLIEDRLYFNQSLMNAVDRGSKGQLSVAMLTNKLESRVKHDKEVSILNEMCVFLCQKGFEFSCYETKAKVLPSALQFSSYLIFFVFSLKTKFNYHICKVSILACRLVWTLDYRETRDIIFGDRLKCVDDHP